MEKEIEAKTDESGELIYGDAVKLDDKDIEILKILDRDGRLPISKISEQVGLSRDAIKYRIEKLIEKKVILKFSTIVNPPKYGYTHISWVLVSLENLTKEREEEFIRFLKAHPNVTYLTSTGGRWDYNIEITAKDPGHFDEILKLIRRTFSDIIKDYENVQLMKEYKRNYFSFAEKPKV